MKKVPKLIIAAIELRNQLNTMIREWVKKNVEDLEGLDIDHADITTSHKGKEQFVNGAREWCLQFTAYEDSYYGEYYWETEEPGKYLHMHFDI